MGERKKSYLIQSLSSQIELSWHLDCFRDVALRCVIFTTYHLKNRLDEGLVFRPKVRKVNGPFAVRRLEEIEFGEPRLYDWEKTNAERNNGRTQQ